MQLNLHHAVAAVKNLIQRAKDQQLSIACVQEIYEIGPRPVGVPAHFKFFYSSREKLKAGIIVFNPNIQAMKVFSSKTVVAITFTLRGRNILLLSVYCPLSEDLESTLQQVEQCLNTPHDGLIIAGDFNAKSPVWGSNQEDDKGQKLSEFCSIQRNGSPEHGGLSPDFSWIQGSILDRHDLLRLFHD
ncbi:hypothetical protein AVEN_152053-1 [Araneus ventricosus]|uniref:Endonuclease/exonuclease/phosphatase domain-containing protein n=1 Tax=Araneus ventricosus TaxID=182803 RepID=A0A4Y2NDB1_ARAVE|nr:hypothetical protein AVEN_152053-1 [Araneus ventricosus]